MDEDPVHQLSHDHAELNLKVLRLGTTIARLDPEQGASSLAGLIDDLRELLFLHFAREEEGLFPYVTEVEPDLAPAVDHMAIAHDQICGAVARMGHLAAQDTSVAAIALVFDRFERAYSQHASQEAAVLGRLDEVLAPDQRAKLLELVRGL